MNSDELKKDFFWPEPSEGYRSWAIAAVNKGETGGLFYADEFDHELTFMVWAAQNVARIAEVACSDGVPRIEANILDGRLFNAVVDKGPDGYNIGVLRGLVSGATLASMLLSTRLPVIGEDRNGALYARIMIQFVTLHEVTHARNGHVDFKRARKPGTLMAEAIAPTDHAWALISQTLEFDADAGGFKDVARNVLGLDQQRGPNGPVFVTSTSLAAMTAQSRILGRAIGSYFLLTQAEIGIPGDSHTKTHPPAIVRCMSAYLVFFEIASRINGLTQEEVQQCLEAYLTGCYEAEIVLGEGRNALLAVTEIADEPLRGTGYLFSEPGHFVPSMVMRRNMVSEETLAYISRLKACWREIRPELLKLKLGSHSLA
ncbi:MULTISPECIES: hypothetical protein [Rhizobium]|jgi:hypothetical protein|uniref:hypothetical protein n=3 Tax=Rhizobium/Agrobacterium group TaxID=227290 RepID=UPI000368A5AA|nr:hypothetical protein [Rhizobium leguminosarum]MBA8835027.1 hypothetical protein [Rhizobium leguminosarum]MDH6270479.1 hypothetical protein [Rhizobium leguminosarum]MVO93502.1 hypothetical protein [Rhizobium leguminosarum bv. phaseoli]